MKTGTPIWQAKKLCPGLILVHARHEAYVLLHEQAKEAIEKFHPSPIIRASSDAKFAALRRSVADQFC